ERLEHDRHPSCSPRQVDPVVRCILGKAELAYAEGEHRGERTFEVELPLIDLAEVEEKLCLDASRFPHELARSGKEGRGTKRFDNGLRVHHAGVLARRLSESSGRRTHTLPGRSANRTGPTRNSRSPRVAGDHTAAFQDA